MRISDWSSDVCSSDLMSGLFRPSSGEILLHGNPIHGLDARAINRLGIARSFQITNIFPGLSVFENLRLGIMRRHGLEYNFWKRISGAHKVKQETRSEEHTSELQSLMRISSAVFCLKKKKN